MFGNSDDVPGRGRFDYFTEVHDHDSLTDVSYHRQVVRDEEVGHTAGTLQILKQVDDLSLNGDVQGAYRFVANDEFGFDRQGASDANALALAAAEFVRVPSDIRGIQSDRLQQFRDPVAPIFT
jgi:hypothetical protein